MGRTTPRLSICIATYNRARFIGETLDSIVAQLTPEVEVLVLDGASPDDTGAVVAAYVSAHPGLRYRREPVNSGVDQDYDKAVQQARGDYCWLMTDDDLLKPGAVATVLGLLDGMLDLLVVNAEVRTADFARQLQARLLDVGEDRVYAEDESREFFEEAAAHLKFIGAVIVRRDLWLARRREPYYGTLFVHVGVIFQAPVVARVVAMPLMVIRYGNAMWTARGFEIWMFKWPRLVWSFDGFADASKARVSAREPWRKLGKLGAHRALGGYTAAVYRDHLAGVRPRRARWLAWLVARIPLTLANSLAGVACLLMPRKARLNLYDLARVKHATGICRMAARMLGV